MRDRVLTGCSRCSARAGLTLIEVVAAIAILGTLLAGVVLARTAHTRQIGLAERKGVAIRAADELIAGWWTGGGGVPIGEEGAIESDDELGWRTSIVNNREAAGIGARVVRVAVFDNRATGIGAETEPLVVVEMVVAEEREEREEDGAEGDADDDGTTGRSTYTVIERSENRGADLDRDAAESGVSGQRGLRDSAEGAMRGGRRE